MTRSHALPLFALVVMASFSGRAQAPALERVFLSAPLMPDMVVFQYKGDAGYPSTREEAVLLVGESVMAFDALLRPCALAYLDITLPTEENPTLSPQQLATNFARVAQCSYERFGAKPYWIPQLLDDVEICREVLGEGWHLLTEAELEAFTSEELRSIEGAIVGDGVAWELAPIYYSVDVFVRGRDGALKIGSLSEHAPVRVRELIIGESQRRTLSAYATSGAPMYTGVRCMRSIVVAQ